MIRNSWLLWTLFLVGGGPGTATAATTVVEASAAGSGCKAQKIKVFPKDGGRELRVELPPVHLATADAGRRFDRKICSLLLRLAPEAKIQIAIEAVSLDVKAPKGAEGFVQASVHLQGDADKDVKDKWTAPAAGHQGEINLAPKPLWSPCGQSTAFVIGLSGLLKSPPKVASEMVLENVRVRVGTRACEGT